MYTQDMDNENNLHGSKKTFILLGALIIITIAGAIVPASVFKVKKPIENTDLTSITAINITPRDKSTNQPLTWKQITESNFSDQPEILNKLKDAPIDNKLIDQLNDEENLTASFSKNLYIASSYLKENNITDETSKQDVISQLIEQEAAKIIPTHYLYKDINIAKIENSESIKSYGNNLAIILNGLITKNSVKSDIESLNNFIKDQNNSSLITIKKDFDNSDSTLKKLLKISVPQSAVIYHLALINQVASYRDMLGNMSKAETDSLRANIALKNYAETVLSIVSIYKNMSDYFDMKNIAFSSKEAGYPFTVGYTFK